METGLTNIANRIYLTYLPDPEDIAGRYFSEVRDVSGVFSVSGSSLKFNQGSPWKATSQQLFQRSLNNEE